MLDFGAFQFAIQRFFDDFNVNEFGLHSQESKDVLKNKVIPKALRIVFLYSGLLFKGFSLANTITFEPCIYLLFYSQ